MSLKWSTLRVRFKHHLYLTYKIKVDQWEGIRVQDEKCDIWGSCKGAYSSDKGYMKFSFKQKFRNSILRILEITLWGVWNPNFLNFTNPEAQRKMEEFQHRDTRAMKAMHFQGYFFLTLLIVSNFARSSPTLPLSVRPNGILPFLCFFTSPLPCLSLMMSSEIAVFLWTSFENTFGTDKLPSLSFILLLALPVLPTDIVSFFSFGGFANDIRLLCCGGGGGSVAFTRLGVEMPDHEDLCLGGSTKRLEYWESPYAVLYELIVQRLWPRTALVLVVTWAEFVDWMEIGETGEGELG